MLQDPALLEEVDLAAGGLRWHVRRSAAATPELPLLLLLHGTGSSGRSWDGCTPLLAGRYRLLAPDLPGHGGSSGFADGAASLPRMAQALAALLRALNAAPVAVAGHSAGAALMLQLWLDGALPSARRLLSLNGALEPLPGLAGAVFPPLARAMATLPLLPWLAARAASRPRALQHLIGSTGSRLGAPAVAHYRALLREPAHVAGALRMMAHWDVGPLVPALRRRMAQAPISLMLAAGSGDTTVAPTQSQRVAQQLPGAQFRLLAGLGHLAHEEAPGVVGQLLADLDA
jgi:magnesium chelatase accessory protein